MTKTFNISKITNKIYCSESYSGKNNTNINKCQNIFNIIRTCKNKVSNNIKNYKNIFNIKKIDNIQNNKPNSIINKNVKSKSNSKDNTSNSNVATFWISKVYKDNINKNINKRKKQTIITIPDYYIKENIINKDRIIALNTSKSKNKIKPFKIIKSSFYKVNKDNTFTNKNIDNTAAKKIINIKKLRKKKRSLHLYNQIIDIEEVNKKQIIMNSDVLLSLYEICLNTGSYNLKDVRFINLGSSKFWNSLLTFPHFKEILKIYKIETLKKVWRILQHIDNDIEAILKIKNYSECINTCNLKLKKIAYVLVESFLTEKDLSKLLKKASIDKLSGNTKIDNNNNNSKVLIDANFTDYPRHLELGTEEIDYLFKNENSKSNKIVDSSSNNNIENKSNKHESNACSDLQLIEDEDFEFYSKEIEKLDREAKLNQTCTQLKVKRKLFNIIKVSNNESKLNKTQYNYVMNINNKFHNHTNNNNNINNNNNKAVSFNINEDNIKFKDKSLLIKELSTEKKKLLNQVKYNILKLRIEIVMYYFNLIEKKDLINNTYCFVINNIDINLISDNKKILNNIKINNIYLDEEDKIISIYNSLGIKLNNYFLGCLLDANSFNIKNTLNYIINIMNNKEKNIISDSYFLVDYFIINNLYLNNTTTCNKSFINKNVNYNFNELNLKLNYIK